MNNIPDLNRKRNAPRLLCHQKIQKEELAVKQNKINIYTKEHKFEIYSNIIVL